MKNRFKFLLCLALGTATMSCNDYLDVVPDNVATIDNAFADHYTTERFLSTCYSALPKSGDFRQNPGFFGSCDFVVNLQSPYISNRPMGEQMFYGLGNATATTTYYNFWSGGGSLYAGIRDCNTFLDNIEKVQDLTRSDKDRMIAEVKLIKAYLHFYLISFYGPICPLRQSLPVNEETVGTRVYREKVDDCFQYVVQLLDEVTASKALPGKIQNLATELGRFTEPAAYAIKAKVLAYWASPLFNGNTEFNGFLDHKGEPFFNQVKDEGRWNKALVACKEALDICDSVGIRLYQTSDLRSTTTLSPQNQLINTLRSPITERWNVELIWGNSVGQIGQDLMQQCAPSMSLRNDPQVNPVESRLSAPISIAEMFYSKHGVPIEEDIEYNMAGRYAPRKGDEEHQYYIQRGETTAALNFDREPRFYSSLGFDRGKWYGNGFNNLPADDINSLFVKNRYSEWASISNPGFYNGTGYFPKKLVPVDLQWKDQNAPMYDQSRCPFPEFRYADLLLLYAEALNETLSTPSSEVWEKVDMVRARAGLEGVVESWSKYSTLNTKPTTKAGARQIIKRERKIELAFEGQYFWDSRRWKDAPKEQNRPILGWNVLGKDIDDYYQITSLYTQKFILRNYFAPIPEGEMINNPNLIQNPGY